jgi:hypothetical protein
MHRPVLYDGPALDSAFGCPPDAFGLQVDALHYDAILTANHFSDDALFARLRMSPDDLNSIPANNVPTGLDSASRAAGLMIGFVGPLFINAFIIF